MAISKQQLQNIAEQYGFNRCFVTTAQHNVALTEYDRFLSKGYHGSMDWMVRSRPPRANIHQLLPTIQTMVVLGVDYWHPRPVRPYSMVGRVSCYAWGRDYHKVITKRLQQLLCALQEVDATIQGYWSVDSRPIIERGWAEKAGLGFVGKNCMIIAPADSSYFFLGTLALSIEIEPDIPITRNHCGKCTRCLDQCPTNAFVAPKQMDARKCISYLTIEHTGVIEKKLAVSMGDWIFGCDVCQDVCPHNHRKMLSMHADLAPRQQLAWLDIAWLFAEKEEKILDVLAGTPLRRTGIAKLQRNAVVVVYNHVQKEETIHSKGLLEIFRSSAQPLVQKQLQELDWL